MYNSGGIGSIYRGETDLIHALQTLKRQVERGTFSTNVSTLLVNDVPSIITSDELAQIQQYLSSVLATSVENTPLFEALLSLQGLSSISEYNALFAAAAQGIIDNESTMTGLEGEIHVEVDKLPLAVLNKTNRQIDYDSAKFTYSTSIDTFSTISSYYHSSQVAYMNSIQDYINASTLEYTSTVTLIREYNTLYTAYWSSIVSEYGLHWYIYDPSQTGGGNSQSLLNILSSYSSVQLPSFILEDIAGINIHSTAIRTLDAQIAEYQSDMSSHILTDYSTLISTYTQNIMEYQNEILSLTLGDIHREASTMIGLSTQYICSIQYDISTATGAAIAQSTYNYYDRLLRELSTNIGYWSSVYTSSLESFSSIERQCSSIRQMVHFLQLEEAEVGAMAKHNSTGLLKSALEDMISQIGQGINIDDYFNSIQATFAGLQSGGASLADVQTMYSTVNILYSRYSAQLSTATYNRSMVPPTLDDIASIDLSTSIAINNANIAERQATYDKNILSSNTITRLLSSQMQYLARYISTSTISDSYLSSIYNAEYAQYQSTIQRLLEEKYSTQQAIYKYSNASMIDSILLSNAYNTELRIIQRLVELGYVIDSTQSGGGLYESISSQKLTLGSGGLIGDARNAVCTQQADVDAIVKSIDDITNAITNINTGSMVTVNTAVQKLNTDSAIWLGYADSNYTRQSKTSEYKMLNYLYTLYTFSTMLTTDMLENRDQITTINYNIWKGVPNTSYIGIGITPSTSIQTATTDYIALKNGLSTSSVQIRNFRPILESFINVISAENFSNQYYLACKKIYEKQSYYRVYQGGSFPDKMSNYDFERLKTTYDLSIQNVNRYTTYRRNMYQPFLNSVNTLIPSLRNDIYYDLTHNRSPILPLSVSLRMEGNFDLKPPRAVFTESGIPTTTLLDCPPATVRANQSAIQHIPYASTPTTTLNTTVYGTQGQYVSISRDDGNYEILQILVIDSTGKNVAFGKSVLTTVPIASSSSFIVNGQYSDDVPANFTPYFKSPASESPNLNKFIIIDLGKIYDITSIQYVKSNKSTYDSRGLLITVFDSNQIPQTEGELKANTSIEYINFRKDVSVKSIGVNPSRKGVCGYMGRYIRISKSSGTFKISQVAVVSLNGVNIAKSRGANYYSLGNSTPISAGITDGSYYSRPATSCFIRTIQNSSDYIGIDLGSEMEVIAVHLYNINDKTSTDQAGTVIGLYTEDYLLAYQQTANTNNRKEVLDFRVMTDYNAEVLMYSNSEKPKTCSTDISWPSFYGTAGIICKYISLTKTPGTGQFGFTKIKAVDKSGRDVAQFKVVTASSEATANSRYYGVGDAIAPSPRALSYIATPSDANPVFLIDLAGEFEICSIIIYRCSEDSTLTDNVQVRFHSDATTPFFSLPVTSGQTIFFDTRYDPEGSTYPTDTPVATDTSVIHTYGVFGTLALSVDIPLNVQTIQITEGTGQELSKNATITRSSSKTTVTFNNLREVNSVIVDSAPIGTRIILRDCDGFIINNKPITYVTTNAVSHRLADFRNPAQQSNTNVPLVPLSYDTIRTTANTDVRALYAGVVTNGIQMSDGIVARYVKVIPPAGGTLYLSQIIVVDSRGINVAYQKDAFTPDTGILASGIPVVSTAVKAVDGVYEQTIEMDVSLLSFENYQRKELSESFVSSQYWVVDLGAEYLVNSVVYVSANGRSSDSVAAMVELYNAQTNPVAIQAVSKYVKIFGVDILDFRDNRAASAYLPGCYLEVNKRTVEAGTSGCGMMIQYIRIEAADAVTPIRLSQLIAINPDGINMALYMPSYSPQDTIGAYKLVDGKYYEKLETPLDGGESEAFMLSAGTGKYVEVNFGNELEIVKVFLLKTKEAANYGNLRIKLYNKFRDIIANLNTAGSTDYTNVTLSIGSSSNPFVLPPSRVLGVSIIAKLGEFKNAGGLIPASVLNSPVTTVTPLNQVRVCADSILTVTSRYTRGSSGGIMARYVRVYNINHYVQISQIMVYGDDGTNYAYGAPCKSDSIFPGTYVGKATDGKGGYYHSARPCSDSYKSGGKRYDFLQIDLGSTREILGIRCIFPSDNQGQNIGSRIQLLDESSGQPNLILAQYIVGSNEFQEVRIDFRQQPVTVPISTKIMPKIYSTPGLSALRSPNGVVEVDGKIYIVDTLANRIWVKNSPPDTSAATVFWSAAAGQTPYPVGITADSTYLYVTCYGSNTIMQIPISSPVSVQTMATSIPIRAPYGICFDGTMLYITSYVGSSSAIYTVDITTNTTTSNTIAIAYPNSISFATINGSQSLLVCSAMDKCVWQVNTTSYTVGKYIGAGGIINISLAAPSAITYDPNTSILFISDFVQGYVYSVRLTTGSIERLAGTGTGGYSGDMKQGSLANLDGPMCVYYSVVTGYLYVSDYNNKRLRYIDLYSKAALVIPTTTVIPWTDWTTTTLGSVAVSTMSTSTTYQPVTITPSTFTQITSPPRIFDVKTVVGITAFYMYGSALYYCANGSMYIDGNSSPIVTGLGTITCITVDGGQFYLCDVTNKCVWTVSAVAPYANKTRYIGSTATIAAPLITPVWIGFDRNRRLYIADTDANCIRRMNKFGTGIEVYVGQSGTRGSSPLTVEMYGTDATLSAPHAFVFDSRNNLIFVDSGHEAVYRVMNENGRIQNICNFPSSLAPVYVDTIKAESSLPVPNAQTVKIRDPWGIAIDSANTLYVTSYTGEQIVKMIFDVNALTYSLDVVAGFGADVAGISGMRNTDPEFGYNITANSYISTIAPLEELETLAKYASLNHPGHIYYVGGNLYFLETATNRIRKITDQAMNTRSVAGILPYGPMNIVANYSRNTYNTTISTFISTSISEETSALMVKFNANSACVDMAGNVYFPNKSTGNILKIDTKGDVSIVTSGLLTTVDGIAIYKDIYLYVTDGVNVTRVTILDGMKVIVFPLASCSKIAISPVGLLYVSSGTGSSGSSVKVYNLKTGATITTISLSPILIDSLCVDSDRKIYIGTTNVNVCKIYKYDAMYTQVAVSPAFPTDPVNYTALPAKDLTVSNGKLYYISNNSVYVTDTSLSSLGTIVVGQNNIKGQTVDGSYSNTTTLYNPRGICIDLNGVMYIIDESAPNPMNSQSAITTILLKNSTYTPLQTGLLYTVAGTNAPGTITPNLAAYMETFNNIKGICYDSTGRMFIADSRLNTISMIDTTGVLTTFVGSISTGGSYTGDNAAPIAATLNYPLDIKMSKSDVLYIADTGNNAIRRVKVFDTNYHIETYVSGISSPMALAIDSYENVYVATANNMISIISPLTETPSTITTRPYPVNALATDSADMLYYTGNDGVYKVVGAIPDTVVLSGLSTPTGLAIDASNKIYVSDTGNNRILSANTDGTSVSTIVGDGTLEPVFALNSDVAQNIYGNGSPPTTRAFSAPGTLAVNSGRSLLISQPTKVSLLSLGGTSGGFVCGNTATSLTIRTSRNVRLSLSQIVALDNTGTNVLLKSSADAYFDGFYGCKLAMWAWIEAGTTLTIPIASADITFVLLYVGSLSKMNWNGATVTLGSMAPRTIQGIQEDPSIQYICLDFRNKTPACLPFINYVNKYKLQLTSSPTTETYRVQYVRYVRIALPPGYSIMNLTRVCVIHAETGVNLLTPGQIPVTTAAFKGIIGYNSIGNIASGTMGGSLVAPTAADAWLEYDLGDEYPIEQVIIYDLTIPKYIVTGYTSNRTPVLNPSSYNTLDNFVKYIRVHGSGYAAPSVSAITYNGTSATVPALTTGTRPYYEYPLGTPNALQTINVVAAAVSPTVPHMLIAYNEAYEEVARTGMTSLQTVASSPPSLTIPNPSYLAYSFIPIVGLRRVRYIRLQSLATAPVKISQLIAFDSNCVNISYKKTATASSNIGTMAGLPVSGSDTTPFTTAAADTAAPYWELDLGQEYELIQIVYVNNTGISVNAQMILMDAFRIQRGSSPYTINTTSYQSFDLRSDPVKHYVALPAPVTGSATSLYTVPDTSLQGFLRGRYVRIENATPIVAIPITLTSFAGTYGTSGSGTTTFNTPRGSAIDAAGNIYVADTANNRVCMVTTSGVISVIATGFNSPYGVAVKPNGSTVYVADTGNNKIMQIALPGGTSTLLAGSGAPGLADGAGAAALFNSPRGISLRSDGIICIADYNNSNCYRKITPAGVVSTVFSLTGVSTFAGGGGGYSNGNGLSAQFNQPYGVSVDLLSGNIYVADTFNNRIRKILPDGTVSSLTGPIFNQPKGVAVDSTGNIYVADFYNHRICKITMPGASMSVMAGNGSAGSTNGMGSAATFNQPTGVAVDTAGNVYVADFNNSLIRMVKQNGDVSTMAGSFSNPSGVAVDSAGNIYVADSYSGTIKKISMPGGVVSTVAGNFNMPTGVAVDSAGNIYVSEKGGHYIRKITMPGANVSIVAGDGSNSYADGIGISASFRSPYSVALNAAGNLYVADIDNQCIRQIVIANSAPPIAIATPAGICVDSSNAAYIADSTFNAVVKITSAGVTSTFVGTDLSSPQNLYADSSNNIYISDVTNNAVKKISPSGTVTTIINLAMYTAGTLNGAALNSPSGILLDSANNTYIVDSVKHCIIKMVPAFSSQPFSVTTPKIYDIYGMNLVNGKVITPPSSTTDYGATWEIDLGQEYSIRDIVYTGTTVAIAVYNRMKAEVWRYYISTWVRPPFPSFIPSLASLPVRSTVRFIRIVGASTINHVEAIDSRDVDIAVWKPVRVVSNGSIVSYNTFEGLYSTGITITATAGDRIEIDLGANYKLKSVKVYLFTSPNPTVTLYDTDGTIVNPSPSIVTFAASASTKQRNSTYGIRARYIALTTLAASASITHLAVLDALGRNLIQTTDKRWSDGHVLLAGTYNEFDLGAEHDVAFVSVYSAKQASPALTLTTLPAYDTTLVGATVRLMDAYYNTRVSRTLEGIGSRYNIDWALGASLGPYYASPPAGVSVVANTANAMWQFPITEQIVGTTLNLTATVGTYVRGIAVASDEVIFFTTNTGLWKYRSDLGSQPTKLVSAANLQGLCFTLDQTALIICGGADNCIYYYHIQNANIGPICGGGRENSSGLVDPWYFDSYAYSKMASAPAGSAMNFFPEFNNPCGVSIMNEGYVIYITDSGNNLIRKIALYNGLPFSVTNLWALNRLKQFSDTVKYYLFYPIGNPYTPVTSDFTYMVRYSQMNGDRLIKDFTDFLNYATSYVWGTVPAFDVLASGFASPTGIMVAPPNVAAGGAGMIYVTDYSGGGSTYKITMGGDVTRIQYISPAPTSLSIGGSSKLMYMRNAFGAPGYVISSQVITYSSTTSTDGYTAGWTTVPAGITPTPSAAGTAKSWQWPGVAISDTTNINAPISNNQAATCRDMSTVAHKLEAVGSTNTTSVMYFYDSVANAIRKLWTPVSQRTGYCIADLNATVPANSFVLSKTVSISPYTTAPATNINNALTVLGKYTGTSPLVYSSSSSTPTAGDVDNKYYSLPDKPCMGPYNNTTILPIVDPTGQYFVKATYAEVLDLTPPSISAFTYGSVTGISFQIITLSADYATGYSYSLNGDTPVMITLPLSTSIPLTITGLTAGSYIAFTVIATNNNGSTPITQYIQLAPPAPVLNAATAITSTGFTMSWSPVVQAGKSGYFTSYTYSLNGGADLAVSLPTITGSTISLAITGLTEGSNPSISVKAKYTGGSNVLTSLPSATTNVQLAPPAPILSAATAITSTGFTVSWTPVVAAANTAYTTSYTYSLNGGAAVAVTVPTTGATITLPVTGIAAGSNPSISVTALYTYGSYVSSSLPSATINVQLAPPAPVLGAATDITRTGFTANWTPVIAAANAAYTTSYTYSLNGGADLAVSLPTITGSTITLPVTGIAAGSNPSISIKTIYTSGSSVLTSLPSATTNVQLAPPAPILSAATAITSTGFTVSWTPVVAAANTAYTTSYTYSLNGGAAVAVTVPTTGATITLPVTGIAAGSNPSISVTALYTYGSYVSSSLPSATTNVQLAPPAPVLSAATDITSTGFTANWTPVVAAGNAAYTTSYTYSLNGGTYVAVTLPTTTGSTISLPITGLVTSSNPSISVKAIYTSGSSVLTSLASATTNVQLAPPVPIPPAPTINANATDITSTGFTVSWTPVTQVANPAYAPYTTSYSYSLNGGADVAITSPIISGSTMSSQITGLPLGSNPYISLKTVNTNGSYTSSSLASGGFNVQLAPPAPDLKFSNVTSTGFTVSWSPVVAPQNLAYSVSYTYSLNGGAAVAVTVPTTGPTITLPFTGLAAGPVPSISVTAKYTKTGGSAVLSTTSDITNVYPIVPLPSVSIGGMEQNYNTVNIRYTSVTTPGISCVVVVDNGTMLTPSQITMYNSAILADKTGVVVRFNNLSGIGGYCYYSIGTAQVWNLPAGTYTFTIYSKNYNKVDFVAGPSTTFTVN